MRDPHNPRTYFPDADSGSSSGGSNSSGAGSSSGGAGVYPVVHAVLPGAPVTLFTARAGARVEPSPSSGGVGAAAAFSKPPFVCVRVYVCTAVRT